MKKLAAKRFLKKGWISLPADLFGTIDINDFDDASRYNNFLNNVRSLADLQRGLRSLGPLASDAFSVATKMDVIDFIDFKMRLARERMASKSGEPSRMPERYYPIIIPEKFFMGLRVSSDFGAPLGTTLLRILEVENNS